MRTVRSLLEECEVSEGVGSCKENVRRNVRYLFKLGVVRSLLEKCEVLIELVVVRRMLEEIRGIVIESCKEFVRRIQRYSIELGVVRIC